MNRISLLASLCEGSSTVLDIGCDHGYVLIKAIKEYNVEHGIASDIAIGPLRQAQKNVEASGINDKIELVLSDGFSQITQPFSTIVLAGMGGCLIVDILSKGLAKLSKKKMILQPNSDRELVRTFLYQNGFKIEEEYSFYDQGIYYEVFTAIEGKIEYNSMDLKYGPILRKEKNQDYVKHYREILNQKESILTKIKNLEERERLTTEILEIQSIIGEV